MWEQLTEEITEAIISWNGQGPLRGPMYALFRMFASPITPYVGDIALATRKVRAAYQRRRSGDISWAYSIFRRCLSKWKSEMLPLRLRDEEQLVWLLYGFLMAAEETSIRISDYEWTYKNIVCCLTALTAVVSLPTRSAVWVLGEANKKLHLYDAKMLASLAVIAEVDPIAAGNMVEIGTDPNIPAPKRVRAYEACYSLGMLEEAGEILASLSDDWLIAIEKPDDESVVTRLLDSFDKTRHPVVAGALLRSNSKRALEFLSGLFSYDKDIAMRASEKLASLS